VPALEACAILTVRDLARSALFGNATAICDAAAASEAYGAWSRPDLPRDILRSGYQIPVADLPGEPVNRLSSPATPEQVTALGAAIGAVTIHDLASWAPYLASVQISRIAAGIPDYDSAQAPADLVPTNGQFPTERVQYETLVFDDYVERLGGGLDAASQPPIDVTALLSYQGFPRLALGAVLTYTQSWYTKALALGNLIHSVALGPGESTRIAMIDWSRRTRSATTEAIAENEALDSDIIRNRAITESIELAGY
jgi:hypothetical protein